MSLMLYIYDARRSARSWEEDGTIARIAARLGTPSPKSIPRVGAFIEFTSPEYIGERADAIFCGDRDWASCAAAPRDAVRKMDGVRYGVWEDAEGLHVATDGIGSVSLWFYSDAHRFICSSSLRVLAMARGAYEPDPEAFHWFYCQGHLHPDRSWCREVHRLPGHHHLTYRFQDAMAVLTNEPLPPPPPRRIGLEDLGEAIERAVASVQVGPGTFLALSGGYDSRVLLHAFLKQGVRLPCMTYGEESLVGEPSCDAAIAQGVARQVQAPIEVLALRRVAGWRDPERLLSEFQQYVAATEGAIDEFGLYGDLLVPWRDMGMSAMAVGDEAFGWSFVGDDLQARQMIGLHVAADYLESEPHHEYFSGIFPRELPSRLARGEAESCQAWSDRLYREHRLPSYLNPFSTWRARRMYTFRPFLYDTVIRTVCGLTDRQRADKALFKRYAARLEREVAGRSLPFTGRKPFPPLDLPTRKALLDLALHAIRRSRGGLVDPALAEGVHRTAQARMTDDPAGGPRRSSDAGARPGLARFVPKPWKHRLRKWSGFSPSRDTGLTYQYPRILTRMAIAATIADVLAEDAQAFSRARADVPPRPNILGTKG